MLDYQRLGKQRVETYQILRALARITTGWSKHPAVKMWENHELALVEYGITICEVWKARGYNDTCLGKIADLAENFESESESMPDWLGDESFHQSHQSNLLRKDPAYYGRYFDVSPYIDYVWPV